MNWAKSLKPFKSRYTLLATQPSSGLLHHF